MSDLTFRLLSINDAPTFRELRLIGLKDAPRSFLQEYEEEVDRPLTYFQNFFKNGWIVGAFEHDALVGIAGLYIHRGKKFSTRERSGGCLPYQDCVAKVSRVN